MPPKAVVETTTPSNDKEGSFAVPLMINGTAKLPSRGGSTARYRYRARSSVALN